MLVLGHTLERGKHPHFDKTRGWRYQLISGGRIRYKPLSSWCSTKASTLTSGRVLIRAHFRLNYSSNLISTPTVILVHWYSGSKPFIILIKGLRANLVLLLPYGKSRFSMLSMLNFKVSKNGVTWPLFNSPAHLRPDPHTSAVAHTPPLCTTDLLGTAYSNLIS